MPGQIVPLKEASPIQIESRERKSGEKMKNYRGK
jgi:hypothetical protein